MDKAKNVRRAAKGTLTRAINAIKELIDSNRPVNKVIELFQSFKSVYQALEAKHDEYTMLLDDKDFDKAEKWMQVCSREYASCSMMFNDYVKVSVAKNYENNVLEEDEVVDEENNENSEIEENENHGHQSPEEESVESMEKVGVSNTTESKTTSSPFFLKHEKPKLPKFDGDVRQYFIFKSDFQHAVDFQHPYYDSSFMS